MRSNIFFSTVCHAAIALVIVASVVVSTSAQQSPQQDAKTDLYGDPLPYGASVRLGTTRYRFGGRLYFLPDGQLLTAGEGGVHIVDYRTGQKLRTISSTGIYSNAAACVGNSIAVVKTEFDREKDECQCTLRVHDLKMPGDGRTMTWSESRLNSPQCVAISPDQSTIVVGGESGALRFWDVMSGEEILNYSLGNRRLDAAAFSPDGKQLAVGGRYGAYLWSWLTGDKPHQLSNLPRGATGFAFSPDGKLLATLSSEHNGVRLWNVAERRFVKLKS